MKRKIKIGFTDFWKGYVPEDSYFVKILRKYFDVEIIDTKTPLAKGNVEYLFYSVFSQNYLDFDCVRIFYTAENIIPDFNLCDYAIGFEKMIIGDRYFRYPLYYSYVRYYRQKFQSDDLRNIYRKDKADKKFCATVISNSKNAEPYRNVFFHRLSQYKTVDSGGMAFNNIGGRVTDKLDFLSNYKFNLAMENVSHDGYCTEKIIEGFIGGGIPVYWGDEKIAEYFNEHAFINCHAYSSMDAVINKIIELDGDDTKYQAMLKEPVFKNGFYDPAYQDICLEKWLISIFDRKYAIRRNRKGAMENYENRYHKQRDKL